MVIPSFQECVDEYGISITTKISRYTMGALDVPFYDEQSTLLVLYVFGRWEFNSPHNCLPLLHVRTNNPRV